MQEEKLSNFASIWNKKGKKPEEKYHSQMLVHTQMVDVKAFLWIAHHSQKLGSTGN